MRDTPRARAAAALAVIDAHHDAYGHSGPYDMPKLNLAYAQLGAAMQQIYGPLPDERLVWHKHHQDDES